jgi:Ferritin-like domain
MEGTAAAAGGRRWTRAGMLRAALGGGAVVAGGAAIGAGSGSGTSLASPSAGTDAGILNLFLRLERVQRAFYRAGLDAGHLDGELRAYADTVVRQENQHVEFLAKRLGSRAEAPPRTSFAEVIDSSQSFRNAAVELEEAAIAAYIGQSPNLTRGAMAAVAPLVSVEARQVAWVRDLAGISPAPRAADPARKADDVLADLRRRGWLQ